MIGKKLEMLERNTEEKDTGNNSGRRRGTRNGETKDRRVEQILQMATY